jgi:hypothetical protein
MLKDRLGKVLFIGPAFVTKWMGGAVVNNPASLQPLTNMGYRIARIEDTKFLSETDLNKIDWEGKRRPEPEPLAVPVVLEPIVVEPVKVAPVEAKPVEVKAPIVNPGEEPTAKKRGRPAKTNTTK